MGDYIQLMQTFSLWSGTLEPVLKCCIRKGSMKGFCPVCMENFRYRQGRFYPAFQHPKDKDLLERLSSGEKPFGDFARREENDEDLKDEIINHGLHLTRVTRNSWGLYIYEVMKDPDLRLSDLADLSRLSEVLEFKVDDCKLIDLEIDEKLRFIEKGIKYGYPFYTFPPEMYEINERESDILFS